MRRQEVLNTAGARLVTVYAHATRHRASSSNYRHVPAPPPFVTRSLAVDDHARWPTRRRNRGALHAAAGLARAGDPSAAVGLASR